MYYINQCDIKELKFSTGIFIDGRSDETIITSKNDKTGKGYTKKIKQYHISVTEEPKGKYLTHFTPEPKTKRSKPARQCALGLVNWMNQHGLEEDIELIGSDTTSEMSGHKGGVLTHMEKLLGRRVFTLWSSG